MQAIWASPLLPSAHNISHSPLSYSCLMLTTTILDPHNGSLQPSFRRDLSPPPRHKNSVPRSTSEPPMTRMCLPLLLPSKNWLESKSSSQNLQWYLCPHMHYHPLCGKCQTLMGWEPPQPIKPKPKPSILTFGSLKEAVERRACYQSPFGTQVAKQKDLKKVCSEWRDKQ